MCDIDPHWDSVVDCGPLSLSHKEEICGPELGTLHAYYEHLQGKLYVGRYQIRDTYKPAVMPRSQFGCISGDTNPLQNVCFSIFEFLHTYRKLVKGTGHGGQPCYRCT